MITGDAMFCQREISQAIDDGKGDYLFVVKDNQPELKASIAESLATFPPSGPAVLPPDLKTAEPVEKGHGRLEIRKIAVSAEVVPISNGLARPGCARRTHPRDKRKSQHGDRLYRHQPDRRRGRSRTLAGPVPHTLAIENRLHYVRDVSFNEDRCRVRSGARALAAIRNLVLYLIRSRGMSVPEARENYREDRTRAIALVTGCIL